MKYLLAVFILLGCAWSQQIDINRQTKGTLSVPRFVSGPITGSKCLESNADGTQVHLASFACGSGSGSGGGTATNAHYIPLENCVQVQDGTAVYNLAPLANWLLGHWEFKKDQAAYISCIVRIPPSVASVPNASIVLEVAANDGTAGHTATFQSCDNAILAAGSFDVGTLACASSQTFTTSTTAYQRNTLTFPIQSTLSANYILVVKISSATTGSTPSNNIFVIPYLKIDQTL